MPGIPWITTHDDLDLEVLLIQEMLKRLRRPRTGTPDDRR